MLISLACIAGTGPDALAQAPLWFALDTPEVVTAVNADPTAPQTEPLTQTSHQPWFALDTQQIVTAANGDPAAPQTESLPQTPYQPSAIVQASPSDVFVEVADAPDLGLAVINRISDNDQPPQDQYLQDQYAQDQYVQDQYVQDQYLQDQYAQDQYLHDHPLQDQTPLLNTESMIGPLQNVEKLFSKLDISDGLLGVAAFARSGPRANAEYYLWAPASYTWLSPAFHHAPLYFEQPNLERYGIGHARVVQPLLSSVHFFGSIPLVPYKTLTHHPRERVYTLGQGRPGNYVPLQRGAILGTSSIGEVSRYWHQGSGY